jgi:serine/threonine-protein kinase RsbT
MLKNRVPLRESNDIVIARQACREIARELGFGTADQTRLATAVSEIGRNIIQYADEGVCAITDESNRQESKIRIVIEYHGPVIGDLNKTIREDLTTNSKPADGLRSAKRLVHCFEAESEPGKTTITLTMKKR